MKEEALKEVLNIIQSTKYFVLEQAPDLAKDIVSYGRIFSLFELSISIFLVVFTVLFFKFTKKRVKNNDWNDDCWMPISIIGTIVIIIGVISSIVNVEQAILAWCAPKMYLLEYVGSILRKK